MPPNFPSVDRIELVSPPLEVVVCQIRFPTVVELAANQAPSGFQKRLVKEYPISRRQNTTSVAPHPELGVEVTKSSHWAFEDKNRIWTVSLGASFLSLETKRYVRFNDFVERFLAVLDLSRQEYPIEIRQRLGLRYVDRLSRSKQDHLPADWEAEIRQDLIPLRSLRGASEPQFGSMESRFSFERQFLTIRSHFMEKGFSGSAESELILDFDSYTEEQGDMDGIRGLLRQFHETSYRAFRWALGNLIRSFEAVQE